MSLEALKEKIPGYAKDLKLNLSTLMNDETLTSQQRLGTLLACALASRNAAMIRAVEHDVGPQLSPEAADAARAAAAIMGMNNIYYRFVHMASAKDYKTLPAKLRMNILATHGIEKVDFELWSLAVSAINGCGSCIDSHEAALRKAGITTEQIQTAVRIASVVHAISAVMDCEEARATA